VGEIGFPRREFLHDLQWWEVHSIIRGFNRRIRHPWSMTRWQTYQLMSAFCGGESMRKVGIHNPTDLIKFTWEREAPPPVSQEEIAQMQAEMDAINAQQTSDAPDDYPAESHPSES